MMPANQLWRKRNSLKVVKIDRNAEHEHIFNLEWIWSKRRGEKLSLLYSKLLGGQAFHWVIFTRLRISAQMRPKPTFDGKFGKKNS